MKGIAALLIAVATTSQAATYTSSDGRDFEAACNQNGFVLTSSPDARGTDTIYLGKGCDAQSATLGSGTWCWANGGFLVDFKDTSIGFPRQELHCSGAVEPEHDCGCP